MLAFTPYPMYKTCGKIVYKQSSSEKAHTGEDVLICQGLIRKTLARSSTNILL